MNKTIPANTTTINKIGSKLGGLGFASPSTTFPSKTSSSCFFERNFTINQPIDTPKAAKISNLMTI